MNREDLMFLVLCAAILRFVWWVSKNLIRSFVLIGFLLALMHYIDPIERFVVGFAR